MSDVKMIIKNNEYTKTITFDIMNHNIDNKINIKNRASALIVLPVAFDNQGGLASTEQRGELPVCAVASVQELSYLS